MTLARVAAAKSTSAVVGSEGKFLKQGGRQLGSNDDIVL